MFKYTPCVIVDVLANIIISFLNLCGCKGTENILHMQIKVKKYTLRMGYTRIYPISGGPSAFVASNIVIQRRGTIQDNPSARRGRTTKW